MYKLEEFKKEIKQRVDLLKNLSVYELLLWSCITFIVLCISPLILGWWTVLFLIIIIAGRAYKLSIKTFLTIFTICVAIAGLSRQNKLLNGQLQQIQLDKRPYLFVDFKYKGGNREADNDILFGADMVFKNTGNMPAEIVNENYLVCDENQCHDYKKWYVDMYGGFPEVKLIPPKSNEGPFSYAAGLKKDAKYACIGVLVSYRGIESNNTYWFYRMDKFKIDRDKNGILKEFIPIGHDVKWDQNRNDSTPELKKPDFPK